MLPKEHAVSTQEWYTSSVFIVYLSFTEPMREWRYRWVLIPLQIFAVLNILLMGYSRIYEGEHWLSDTLGGYISGALWLALFICLYQLTTNKLEERRARRLAEKPVQAQEA